MNDLEYVSVSFKSQALATYVQEYIAKHYTDQDLDQSLKHRILLSITQELIDAYLDYLESGMSLVDWAKDGAWEDYLLFNLESEVNTLQPDYNPYLFVPMDLNGMVLVVLTPVTTKDVS